MFIFHILSTLRYPIIALELLSFACAFTTRSFAADFQEMSWDEVRFESGIRVFRGKSDREGFYSCRAVGLIRASLFKVASIILDTSRRKEWFPELIDAHVVRQISPTERFEYMAVRTPFPLSNRDFVYKGSLNYHGSTKTMDIRFTSVETPETPETQLVRGRIIDSSFSLEQLEDGATIVVHTAAMNPRGFVPNWIVNLVQTNVPFNTIANLRRQAARADVFELRDLVGLAR